MLRFVTSLVVFLNLSILLVAQSGALTYNDLIIRGNEQMLNFNFNEALANFREARLLGDTGAKIERANELIQDALTRYNSELLKYNDSLGLTNEKLAISLENEKIKTIYAESRGLALVANDLMENKSFAEAYDSAYQAKVLFSSLGKKNFPLELERSFGQAVQYHKTKTIYAPKKVITALELIPNSESILLILEEQEFLKISRDGNVELKLSKADQIVTKVISEDGTSLFVSFVDSSAYLVNLKSNSIDSLLPHDDLTITAEFSKDGKYLLTGSRDNSAKLWRIDRIASEPLATLVGHNGNIYEVVFSYKQDLILTRSSDGTVRLWNLKGEKIGDPITQANYIYAVAFSEDHNHIISAAGDGIIKKWNNQGHFIQEITNHQDVVVRLSSLSNTGMGYSYSLNQIFKLLDWENGQEVYSKQLEASNSTMVFASKRKKLFLGLTNGQYLEYSISAKKISSESIHYGHSQNIIFIDYHAANDCLLSTSEDGNARLWMPNHRLWMNIELENKIPIPARFSTDGKSVYAIINNELTVCPLPSIVWEQENNQIN